jgi:hypothetical protein
MDARFVRAGLDELFYAQAGELGGKRELVVPHKLDSSDEL